MEHYRKAVDTRFTLKVHFVIEYLNSLKKNSEIVIYYLTTGNLTTLLAVNGPLKLFIHSYCRMSL